MSPQKWIIFATVDVYIVYKYLSLMHMLSNIIFTQKLLSDYFYMCWKKSERYNYDHLYIIIYEISFYWAKNINLLCACICCTIINFLYVIICISMCWKNESGWIDYIINSMVAYRILYKMFCICFILTFIKKKLILSDTFIYLYIYIFIYVYIYICCMCKK